MPDSPIYYYSSYCKTTLIKLRGCVFNSRKFMMFLISFEIKVRTCSIRKKNKPDQSFSLQKEIFFLRCENVINKIIYKITIKSILIHEYQRKSTQIDTSPTRVNTNRVRHEPTRINTSLTRVNTSSARVITNQG